jgi:hypothetical protein
MNWRGIQRPRPQVSDAVIAAAKGVPTLQSKDC